MKAVWQDAAACVGEPPEMFFPVGRNPQLAEPAKTVCRRCSSVRDCLGYALTHDVDGVWGGTTPAEREALRAKHAIVAHPVFVFLDVDRDRNETVEHLTRGGASSAQIADVLGVAPRTVVRHRTRHSKDLSYDHD